MNSKCFALVLLSFIQTCYAQEKRGANIPWTTIEAENMYTNGAVIGPSYQPYRVETESSGQKCVKLNGRGQFVEFTTAMTANSMVIRYSLPIRSDGNAQSASLGIYVNGNLQQHRAISSKYTMLYGKYPFSNVPAAGRPRNFYDEIRIKDLLIASGDMVRIQLDNIDNDAAFCMLDLADLENIARPLDMPDNALSIADTQFVHTNIDSASDYTDAFNQCIAMAMKTNKVVWIPAGVFKITGDIALPENVTVQGAGIWYSVLLGDEAAYGNANKRVRLRGNGSNIRLSDFAIFGKLDYRSDKENNDGIVGTYGTNSIISRLWIEHTKVGMWIENSSNLLIQDCRMRNTIADGINLCTGVSHTTIKNCTARGGGDDCFAIWPTVKSKQQFPPGNNLIINCTGQLPFLANGAAIYGGESNAVKNCLFTDISQGSAILISTTFPTASRDGSINNNFSGTTLVENCDIKTSGGFDHEWDWRAALEICVDKRSITGIQISNLDIDSSLSNGVNVIAKNAGDTIGVLSHAVLQNVKVTNSGIGLKGSYGLYVSKGAHGSLVVKGSEVGEVKNEATDFIFHQ